MQSNRLTQKSRRNVTALDIRSQTHPRTCCREGSSPVCSPGTCSPAAPRTSYTSGSKLRKKIKKATTVEFKTYKNARGGGGGCNSCLSLGHLRRLPRCRWSFSLCSSRRHSCGTGGPSIRGRRRTPRLRGECPPPRSGPDPRTHRRGSRDTLEWMNMLLVAL